MLDRKSMLLGSFWGAMKFLLAFARSILLVPLLLSVAGKDFYACWVLLAAANAAYMGLYDGFIRYVSNAFNVAWHQGPAAALLLLQSGRQLLLLLTVIITALLAILFVSLPSAAAGLFHTTIGTVLKGHLPAAIIVFAAGATAIQWLRLSYVLNEPLGRLWQSYCFELSYGIVELGLITGGVLLHYSFSTILMLIGSWYLTAALLYYCRLRFQYKDGFLHHHSGSLQRGALMLKRSFYNTADGLADRVTGESLSFVLALLGWPSAIIAQFAAVKTLTNAGYTGMSILQAPLLPKMQQGYALQQATTIQRLLRALWLAAGIAGTVIFLFFPLLERIYIIFTKGKIALDERGFTMLLAALVMTLFGQVMQGFLRSVNKNRMILLLTGSKALIAIIIFSLLPQNLFYISLGLFGIEAAGALIFYPMLVLALLRKAGSPHPLQELAKGLIPAVYIALCLLAIVCFGYALLPAIVAAALLSFYLAISSRKFLFASTAYLPINEVLKAPKR